MSCLCKQPLHRHFGQRICINPLQSHVKLGGTGCSAGTSSTTGLCAYPSRLARKSSSSVAAGVERRTRDALKTKCLFGVVSNKILCSAKSGNLIVLDISSYINVIC